MSRYCTAAFCGSYPWSLTMRLTVRPQTPPLEFCWAQNIWLAFVSGPASGANTPERSVRTPSVMVLSVTPGPALIDPPPPDDELVELEEPLLPQAATASARMTATVNTRRTRVMRCAPWGWVARPGNGEPVPPARPRPGSRLRRPRRRRGSGRRRWAAARCRRVTPRAAGGRRGAEAPLPGV